MGEQTKTARDANTRAKPRWRSPHHKQTALLLLCGIILILYPGSAFAQAPVKIETLIVATGAALDFDGSDDYVQRASSLVVGTNDFTIEAWINPTDGAGFSSIIAQDISGNAPSQFEVAVAPPTPALGTYPTTSVPLSGDTTVTPDPAPTNTTSINVSTSTSFKGELTADVATGVVRVTNAHPANIFSESYLVTVKATGPGGSTTQTFTLTVTDGTACAGISGFTSPVSPEVPEVAVGSAPVAVAIGDFNGDGIQDLAVANVSSGTVSIRLGNGSGGFTSPATPEVPEVAVGSGPVAVAIGDFNGDGIQDFATANQNSRTVSIRLGNGSGGFTSPASPEVAVGSAPVSVAIGDFNGDGMQDLAVANASSGTVSIRLGDGLGGFSGATDVSVGSGPNSVAIGDFNGDGKQDLAVANGDSNTVSIRLGNGSGGFTSPATPEVPEVAVGSAPVAVAIGDFNGDGRQDLAVANVSSGTVSIRLGNGSGGFTSPATPEVAVGSGPVAVAIGDFNGDGIQDFATANQNSHTVAIRLGNGSGGFTSPATPEVAVGTAPFSVAIGDFNGDGRQDFAAANYSSNDVSVRLGVCTPSVVSATTGDSNSNGKIDRLTVVYSEAVNDPNYDAVAVTGYSMPGTGSGTGTTTLVYNLTEDGDGCSPLTLTITNVGTESGNGTSECFAYSHSVFLQSSPNQTPTITGAPGGTFSSTPFGLTINPSTGTIDSATSFLGDYVVTYTTDPVIAGVLDTGATPALTFIAADATDLAGNNLDTAGAPTNATDGAAPTVGIVIAGHRP